ncbi:MAG: BON domain-containing protein [Deltaproteobacteria bacterium]|nr:BON domain-containing protein [Deltaproteobacteria bacterium]
MKTLNHLFLSMSMIGSLFVFDLSPAQATDRDDQQKERISDKAKADKDRIDDKAERAKDRVDDRADTAKKSVDRNDNVKKEPEAGDEITDAWITTKIKSQFLGEKALKGSDISVDTENRGMVILSGNIPNEGARKRAMELARTTKGVREVQDKLKMVAHR